jgi:hypothetical protein
MRPHGPAFEALPRERLLPVALETMHMGHLLDRALMPQVAIATGGVAQVDAIAIDEWMGASPIYTRRMRRLMGIEGDGVGAIMKALQLDVGFPHQYMDVGYKLLDERRGEFWLLHCGALMDTEPHGEQRVIGMCHTIEDPTFDATAYATNPRARVRPIHRPPRRPADRHPHCHWTIEIDPANDPVGPARHTNTVGALPLASVPNERADEASPTGLRDYRGEFVPGFKLGLLSSPTLAAVAREFQIQCHLLSSSAELAVRDRLGKDEAREVIAHQWVGVAWVGAQRLAKALGAEVGDAESLAAVLRLHGALAPGFSRQVETRADGVRLVMEPSDAKLLDPENPGWLGLLARGETRGLEAAAQGAAPHASLSKVESRDGRIVADFALDASRAPGATPQEATLMRFSSATAWQFDTSQERLGR